MLTVKEERFDSKLRVASDVVYHYTSASVLPVFFEENADLYCTNSKCLNDSTEIFLGSRTFAQYLYEIHKLDKPHFNLFSQNITEISEQNWIDAWVMSFTSAKDDLSQWRGYVSKDTGGYAIGFNVKKLVSVLQRLSESVKGEKVNQIPFLTRCWYLEKDTDLIRSYFDWLIECNAYDIFKYAQCDKLDEQTFKSVMTTAIIKTMHIKHYAFQAEKEARIILTVPGENYTKMRVVGGKPRMPIGVPILGEPLYSLIDEIYISPHGNTNTLMAQAQWLKKSSGASFRIIPSEIPYDPSR